MYPGREKGGREEERGNEEEEGEGEERGEEGRIKKIKYCSNYALVMPLQ